MQLNSSVSPSMRATVRSTPLMAIESPSAVPSRTSRQEMTRRPRSASRTAPTSSMMPVNMVALGYTERTRGDKGDLDLHFKEDAALVSGDLPKAAGRVEGDGVVPGIVGAEDTAAAAGAAGALKEPV